MSKNVWRIESKGVKNGRENSTSVADDRYNSDESPKVIYTLIDKVEEILFDQILAYNETKTEIRILLVISTIVQ